MKNKKFLLPVLAIGALTGICAPVNPGKNIIDEVAWVVGDQAIFRSDIEELYQQLRSEGEVIGGDPYCTLPERIAVEKLYLHQAKIDTIEVPENQVYAMVDERLNYYVANFGSKEKVEEFFRKSYPQLREQLVEMTRNHSIINEVQKSLTKDVKATPNEVRKYFDQLPADSIPYIPMQVEVQMISINPTIPRQVIDDIKARLRNYSDAVNKGESDFSTLAILYSDDPGSSMQGGELGFKGRAEFVPEFSNVAFNLNDPKKVSRIVETEYGYHIIQLIEKRGDQVNVRHILLTPKVNSEDLKAATNRLDSIRKEIVGGAFSFDDGVRVFSQDKDTRFNKGIMMNEKDVSSRFEMQDLPPEIARHIEKMNPGDLSEPFVMRDPKRNKDIAVIVRLTERIPGHRASLSEDYNLIKNMYEERKKQEILTEWVEKKIGNTFVRIEDGWKDCDFKYKGWMKEE